MTAARWWFVLLLAWPPAASALDPDRAVSQYVVKTWAATSLGSNTVHSIAQTPDGRLWLGTGAGLVRYDGSGFVRYDAASTADFADGGVSALATMGDTVFAGTTSGALMRRKADGFERLSGTSRAGTILAIAPRTEGGVWVAKDALRPLWWWGGSLHSLDAVDTLTARAVAEAPDGAAWFGTREGLVRVQGEDVRWQPQIKDSVQAVRFDRAGVLWLGTPHGLHRLEGDAVVSFRRSDGLCHENVTALLEDRHGNLWVGTSGGLCRRTAGRFEAFTSAQGLADDDVRSLFEDGEGTLWIGTGDGLTALSDGSFATYGRLEGVADGRTTAVFGGHDAVWIGTASGEVVRLAAGKTQTFALPPSRGRAAVVALYEDRQRSVWFGTENGRLGQIVGGRLFDRTPPDPAGKTRVSCIFEDDEGLMFFATGLGSGQGLARLVNGRFEILPGKRPALGFLHAVYRDARGFWMGSSQGLAHMTATHAPMTRRRRELTEARIRSLVGDDDGSLWLATAGGLVRFHEDRFQAITTREGLPESYLRLVLDDGLGHLWIGGTATLFRLDKREVREVLAGRAARVTPIVFDTADGLRTTEALFSSSPGFRAADGRLWIATAKGVSVIDPRRVSLQEPAPAARIEAMTVDGVRETRAVYGPGRGEVTLEYGAATLSERVRFRQRLEGLDDDWVDAGSRRQAYYSSLQPGRYRFLVTASNRHGVWNGTPAALAFEIRPPFHRRPAFFALVAAALAATALFIHRLRLRQMRARFAAVIGERTRIARELHDTLAQGVAGIRLQVETGLEAMGAGDASARDHFQLAGAMARSSLEEVRRSIWVLRAQTSKGNEGLAATLSESLRHLTAGSALKPEVTITGAAHALPPAVEHNLLRIVHELVLNAVRHSGATSLTVVVDFAADAVHIRVKDDGRGFDVDAHLAASGAEHFGLLGMVERAQALGGTLDIRSRPGEGTEVACRLPYDQQP